jgi:hypothetical protein
MAVIVGAVIAYASYYAVVQNTCKVNPPITDSATVIENVKWKIYALVSRYYADGHIKTQEELDQIIECPTCISASYGHIGVLKRGWHISFYYKSPDNHAYDAFVTTDRCGAILDSGVTNWGP